MMPEEFDAMVKNKISQMSYLPGLECHEEEVWQKVNVKLGKGGTSGFVPPFLFGLVFILGVCLWNYWSLISPKKTVLLSAPSEKKVEQVAIIAQHEETTTVDTAKALSPFVQKKTDTTVVIKQLRREDGKEDQTSAASVTEHGVPLERRPEDRPSAYLPILPPKEQKSANNTFREGYLGLGGNYAFAGRRWGHTLSRNATLAYGLAVKQPYPTFQLPSLAPSVEGRYYLLSKDKRFHAFVYAQLNTSLNAVYTPPLNLQVGAEARYRLSRKGATSAWFFFVRMPAYQRTIIPGRLY